MSILPSSLEVNSIQYNVCYYRVKIQLRLLHDAYTQISGVHNCLVHRKLDELNCVLVCNFCNFQVSIVEICNTKIHKTHVHAQSSNEIHCELWTQGSLFDTSRNWGGGMIEMDFTSTSPLWATNHSPVSWKFDPWPPSCSSDWSIACHEKCVHKIRKKKINHRWLPKVTLQGDRKLCLSGFWSFHKSLIHYLLFLVTSKVETTQFSSATKELVGCFRSELFNYSSTQIFQKMGPCRSTLHKSNQIM